MTELTFALAFIVWCLLPGFLLLSALGLGEGLLERLTGSVGLSLALVAAAAYGAELIGLPVAPAPVAMLVLVLVTLVLGLQRLGGRSGNMSDGKGGQGRNGWVQPSGAAWLVLLLPIVVVSQLEPVTSYLLLPPTMHDGLDHANWFRLIYELRSLDPAVLLAPPLSPDGNPGYYPYGMHAVLALVAETATLDPMVVLMRGLVVISAALPLSVFAFVSLLAGRGWPALAAAAFSLMFWWLPYQVWGWGGYPLLTGAVAALPLSRLALEAVRRKSPSALLAALVCGLGLLTIHPSQAFGALLVCAVVSMTWVAARRAPAWTVAPFALGLGAAALSMTYGATLLEPVGSFMDKADAVGAALAARPTWHWPGSVFPPVESMFPAPARVVLGVLYLTGGLVALRRTELWPFLSLHVAGLVLVASTGAQTWWTSLWYHAPERVWYLQYASLPALVGLGAAGLVSRFDRWASRWRSLAWTRLLWPVLAVVGFITLYQPYTAAAFRQLWLYGYRNENLTFSDNRVLADFAWIDGHIDKREVLFNAPADWGLPLPFTGRRTVFWSGGYALDLSVNWNELLRMLNAGDPHTSQAARELERLGVHYVYAASLDPALRAGGRQALDGDRLQKAAGLDNLFSSSSARVFRIRDEPNTWFGVRDTERIRYYGFTTVEGDPGREWRWTAERGRVRIWPGVQPQGRCFIRILGSPLDTYELHVDEEILTASAEGFDVPRALVEREFLDLVLTDVEAPSITLPPDQPPLDGVRVTDVGFRCGS